MTIINDAFINALLADPTYALTRNGLNGLEGDRLFDFLKNRLTPELAQYVVDNFIVVTHIETSDTSSSETGFG